MGKEYWQYFNSEGYMCASVRYVATVIIWTDASTVQSAVVNVYQPLWHYETLLSHLCHSHDSQERKVTISLHSVMHVRFTYVFVLDTNFEILILEIQEEIVQSQPLKSAIPTSLNPVVTWSDNYTFRNAWPVSSTLWSLAQPGKRPHSLQIIYRPSCVYSWRN